jgi:NitT/TauT family transport system substrate-binding protein
MDIRSALMIASLSLLPAHALALDKITVGTVGVGSSTEWPVYVAIDQKFMEEQNVEIDFIGTQSSSAVMQQITAGSINMGTTGLADPLRAADHGAPIRILRTGIEHSPYEVYAQPDIKTWADLKGKTIMIGGVKDITRIYFEDMARKNNLDVSSYDYIFAGATAARYAALASGSVAATILTPPLNFKAAGAGYTYLGTSADYTKNFPFTGYPINLPWAQANKNLVHRFLVAYSKAVDWFYQPQNREGAIASLIHYLKSDYQDAANTYDFYVKLHVFDHTGAVDRSGIENLIAILKKQGDIEGDVTLSRFYDPSIAQ